MLNKEIVIFDLDRTLTEDRQPLDQEMASLLKELLVHTKVAIISGGTYEQFIKQFVSNLHLTDSELERLFLLPVSGTSFYQHVSGDGWQCAYKEEISEEERERIVSALESVMAKTNIKPAPEEYGELIEDRLSQVTLSALGQDAPLGEKKAWDPDLKKRKHFKKLLQPLIPEYEIQIGGATSVDVMKQGVDKAYGIQKMSDILKIPISKMLFIGDRLEKDGNDASVKRTGIEWIDVEDPEETKIHIKRLLKEVK